MEVFRHIRYATAQRFKEPVMAAFSEGDNTQSVPTACAQLPFRLDFLMGESEPMEMSEDCHFLTIWTPSKQGKYPVLVWIHGGAYIAGSGEESAYDGALLCKQGDIVVVNISYRLGIFGFLHSKEKNIVNLGLKDQIMALRWIKQHIEQFGGDPGNITVAGQSAGGYSVAAIMATCSEPLFKKAIIQSAPLMVQPLKVDSLYHQCEEYAGKALETMTTDDLLAVQHIVMKKSKSMMPFSPIDFDLSGKKLMPKLEKVLITWQKDDAAPFVAMKLNHRKNFGKTIDKIATRISTNLVFEKTAKKYAKMLRKRGIDAEIQCLDWRPCGSPFGACHCLELSLLFGTWKRWESAKMLGDTSQEEFNARGEQLRNKWIAYIKQ